MKSSFLFSTSLLILMTVASVAQQTQTADVRLRAAQQKETVEGDLRAAIDMYRRLADDKTTPPEIAVKALLQLGRCYERLGSTEARKAYERILAEYERQAAAGDSVAEARRRLAALPVNGPSRTTQGVSVRQIPVKVDGVLSSTVTADGRYAALLQQRTRIELIDLETGARQPFSPASLVNPGEFMYGPIMISPDGQRIVGDVSTGPRSSELRLGDRRTGNVRTIMKSDTAFRIFAVDWSRDGRTILVNAAAAAAGPSLHLVDVEEEHVRALSDSGAAKVLEPSTRRTIRFSPDSRFFAYTALPMNEATGQATTSFGRIYVERIDGRGQQLVAAPENGAMLAGWSPDGRHVLFIADDVGTEHLWAVRVQDGRPAGAPVSLARGLARGEPLTVTAAGALIMTIPGALKFYTAPIDPATGASKGSPEPIAEVNGWLTHAAWSPDGERLAYGVSRGRDLLEIELYMREPGGKDRRLGGFGRLARFLTWTRDGGSLLFAGGVFGRGTSLVRYWVDEGRAEELAPESASTVLGRFNPRLDARGNFLYYMESSASAIGARLIRYDMTARGGTQIATIDHVFDLAPDGEHLVIFQTESGSNETTIRIIDRAGETVRDLVRLRAEERVGGLTWAPDGKWIYFTRTSPEGHAIHRVAADGGDSVFTGLRMQNANAGEDLIVHPSGRQISFKIRTEPELWRVDGIEPILARDRRKP